MPSFRRKSWKVVGIPSVSQRRGGPGVSNMHQESVGAGLALPDSCPSRSLNGVSAAQPSGL